MIGLKSGISSLLAPATGRARLHRNTRSIGTPWRETPGATCLTAVIPATTQPATAGWSRMDALIQS
jgi:hypothetical protein